MNEVVVPENVIDVLATIREMAYTNMFDRAAVTNLAKRLNKDAGKWLAKANSHEFMEALQAMGKTVRR